MEALGIDTKLLLAQTVNFLLFAYIFKRLMYAPFMKYVNKQHADEKERGRLLGELQDKEARLQDREKEIVAEARQKALEIIQKAEETAEKKKKELIKDAQAEVVTMKRKAEQEIQEEKDRMYDDVRAKIVDSSKSLTEVVLKDFVSASKQNDVLEAVFQNLKKQKVYEN